MVSVSTFLFAVMIRSHWMVIFAFIPLNKLSAAAVQLKGKHKKILPGRTVFTRGVMFKKVPCTIPV